MLGGQRLAVENILHGCLMSAFHTNGKGRVSFSMTSVELKYNKQPHTVATSPAVTCTTEVQPMQKPVQLDKMHASMITGCT